MKLNAGEPSTMVAGLLRLAMAAVIGYGLGNGESAVE